MLGDRYRFWVHGNFIDAYNYAHLNHLSKLFGLELNIKETGGLIAQLEKIDMKHINEKNIQPWMIKKMFSKVNCYGLKPDACVDHQVSEFGLKCIAGIVENLGVAPLVYG